MAAEGAVGVAVVGGRERRHERKTAASAGDQEATVYLELISGLGFEVVYMGH